MSSRLPLCGRMALQPRQYRQHPFCLWYTLKQALMHKNFWVIALSFLLIAFALTAPTPNLENILRTQGFSLAQIGGITASFGLAVIAGRLLGGWMLDKFWAPLCALLILFIPAAGCWALTLPDISQRAAFLAVAGIGFGAGFEFDLLAYLVSRYFGQRKYGTIYGCFYTVVAVAGGVGPVTYGYLYDTVGNYTWRSQAVRSLFWLVEQCFSCWAAIPTSALRQLTKRSRGCRKRCTEAIRRKSYRLGRRRDVWRHIVTALGRHMSVVD